MTSKAQARPFVSQRMLFNLVALLLLSAIALIPQHAHAAAGGGGGMPWEGPFDQLRASVTGPFAYVMSLLGIVIGACVLIFGSDLNGFFRFIVLIILIISVLIAAQNWLAGTFGRGAEIAMAPLQMLMG
ncbi:TrbC/VirB2 family protein [Azohydromonas caseinilytica]|uniref:Conjugal transfer protein TrbC n=1 Tax=Azohydromonas caseinilytica TaxID=2728836 RepID=A0A848FDC9_9BURK|nr:TrbC/VirB2 family protein [Azohydromonas caseinilytica]NML17006.1 conjugal transfer protein TrbC [Azohydromonas caseinilytica]